MEPTPLPAAERALFLDVLRGFALLGILPVNIAAHALPVGSWAAQEALLYPGSLGLAAAYADALGLLVARAPTWMRWFRFGPAEWAWRSLSYGKRQPLWRTP